MLVERYQPAKPIVLSSVVGIGWILGVGAIVGLIAWTGIGPTFESVKAVGRGGVGVCLLRGTAVAGAGLGWFMLFPSEGRPNALTCVLIRFLREGANALLPATQVGGEIVGARALTLRGTPASLSAASVVVDVLVLAATQFLFALIGLATLAASGRSSAVAETVAILIVVAIPALWGFYLLQRPIGQRAVKVLLAFFVGEGAWLSFGALDALYWRLGEIYANRAGLVTATMIHMSVWFFGALEVWLILAFMGLPANYPEALIIESLMQAVRGVAFAIPGALGAQEGGLVAICAIFGIPAQVAIAMSLIKRIPDFVFGLPSLVGWQWLEGRALLARNAPDAGRGE